MREIKFRAWKKSEGRMVDHWELCKDGSLVDAINRIKYESIMQYTGLKDKNGVEIYEGDILRPSRYGGIKEYNFPVMFKNGVFKLTGRLAGYPTLIESIKASAKAGNHYEVIGNIYQNPELLD